MNKTSTVIAILTSLFLGLLYFAINQEWIVFRSFSVTTKTEHIVNSLRATKKQMNLSFWNNNKWNTEAVEIIASSDAAQTVEHLVNSWLTLLDEEKVMINKVTLQSALMSENGQLYVSFDRNPFDENSPTYDKWMWVEGRFTTRGGIGTTISAAYSV